MATAASWIASSPIRNARATTAGRSSEGRSASAPARAASVRTSRSTTIRSPSTLDGRPVRDDSEWQGDDPGFHVTDPRRPS